MANSPSDIEKKLAALAQQAPTPPAANIRKKLNQHDRNQKSLTLTGLGIFQILLALFAPVARIMREQPITNSKKTEKEDERKF
ncbi:hypothetical protein QNI23_015720 [Bermanella sp. WJH001]|uniref:hypothetical protein n=1 Tax=Bermanella sp. WJH001 TaxID=3048005 RepID=UPI0024BDBA9A|nr:hypothetical protein [Bermanella sp. WJH001]MDJ1539111.1 hypothetical protein [Bermanella sp. WJH001]